MNHNDFFCIKLPDKMKGKSTYETICVNVEFIHLFIEKALGKSHEFFLWNYACFTNEAIHQYLILLNIDLRSTMNGIIIPKEYKSLIDWVISNMPSQTKIMKRFSLLYLENKDRFYFNWIDKAHEFSIKQKNKFKEWPDIETLEFEEVYKHKNNLI